MSDTITPVRSPCWVGPLGPRAEVAAAVLLSGHDMSITSLPEQLFRLVMLLAQLTEV